MLQIYGMDAESAEVADAVAAFADEKGLRLEQPAVAPVVTPHVTVLHGREWESFAAASELADLLAELGFEAHLHEGGLQNHVVTRNHVALFFGREAEGVRDDAGDVAIRELLCSQERGEAVVLLFADYEMEIHTYVWQDEIVSGENIPGTWDVQRGAVFLRPALRDPLAYRPGTACLASPPREDASCRGTLHWSRGNSVPVLDGCDLAVRNIRIVLERRPDRR